MKIVVLANFPSTLNGKSNGRFIYLAEMLTDRGHQVELVTSDFEHSSKSYRTVEKDWYKSKVTLIHELGYKSNVSPVRLWSHYRWGCAVGRYLKKIEKPDVIYCALPSLTVGVIAAKYCKKHKIRFLIDIQDLWPEALAMLFRNNLLQKAFLPMSWYANRTYKVADSVIAVSDTYVQRALKVNRKGAKGLSVYLGNDGQFFDDSRSRGTVFAHLDNNEKSLYVAYIGTLGYSYDLRCIIKAISIYRTIKDAIPIIFVVMGRGPLKNEFEKYANELGIDAIFTGPLPYSDMVATMCSCDIVVNPITRGAAQSITNKVGDYALSGLPVINTQENPEYRALIEEYKCGINCKVGDAEDVAKAFKKLAKDETLRKEMGENARKLGLERFDRRVTYMKLVEVIENQK